MNINSIIAAILCFCFGYISVQENENKSTLEWSVQEDKSVMCDPDTLRINPFYDSLRYVELIVFSELENEKPNCVLRAGYQGQINLVDSISSMFPSIDLKDFNADGVKDIVVMHNSGARANVTNYLYIVHDSEPYLRKILNFESVVNPKMEKDFNVISSMMLTSETCYKFFRVSKDELISLDTTFCESPDSLVWNSSTLESMSKLLDMKQRVL